MGTIDADAHVFETPATWAHLEESERQFTPRMVKQVYGNERHGLAGNVWSHYWLIDNSVRALESNINVQIDKSQRDLEDVGARVAHMDQMGVDVQVIFPSLFLHPFTRSQAMEYALTRAYNRWMAEIWKKGAGRLRWVAVPPVLQIEKAADELAFARDNGAVGVLMHGLEQDRFLNDPYFFPLFERAGELGLAICVHAGYNSFSYEQIFRGSGGMVEFRFPVVAAFHGLMMKGIPAMFPDVRWGFVEAGAQWVPMVYQDLKVRYRDLLNREISSNLFAESNVFITCQADDDVPYILKYAGEDALVVGTDYGHSDHAADLDAFQAIRDNPDIPDGAAQKILSGNARRLYALD
ncbi:MAG: amidohydrolase [Alphaproteobacteria bacterium]|nr:amidohydrolase [Alphaproteobacteria bacterium]